MKVIRTRTRYKIVGSDYSAQEPRITAHVSQDQGMLTAYKEKKDLYAVIGQSIFHNNYEDNLEFFAEGTEIVVDGKKVIAGNKTHLNPEGKARRALGKTVILATSYGMGPKTAAEKMKNTPEEAEQIINSFFAGFPKVKQAIDNSKLFLKEHGYVEDWAGRRRHLTDYFLSPYEAKYKDRDKAANMTFNPIISCTDRPQIDAKLKSYLDSAAVCRGNKAFEELAKKAYQDGVILTANTGRIAQAERQCFNAIVQGSAASLTKLAMVNIYNDVELQKCKAKLIIPVHDELLMECPAFYTDVVEKRLPEIMIETARPYISTPMSCDPYVVQHWYADEYAGQLIEEYKKLTEKGVVRPDALLTIQKGHSELALSTIQDIIDGKLTEVEFLETGPKYTDAEINIIEEAKVVAQASTFTTDDLEYDLFEEFNETAEDDSEEFPEEEE